MGRYVQQREVDNPLITDGLAYSGQRNAHLRVMVDENAITRIGALVFIRRRQKHHEEAAEDFKARYEALFGSGVPALDNSRPVVDRSPIAHDSGMAAKIDRGHKVLEVMKMLGKANTNVLVDMLILETPCSEYADMMPSGQRNQRQIRAMEDERLAVLDALSELWGYASRKVA